MSGALIRVCPARQNSRRRARTGFTKSSTTAFASSPGATAWRPAHHPQRLSISPIASRSSAMAIRPCRCALAFSTARRSWSTPMACPSSIASAHRQHDRTVTLCAFDLLELDGGTLRRTPARGAQGRAQGPPAPGHAGIALQSALRGRRRDRLPAGLHARLRGHRLEAARLAISGRPGRSLAQGQEPGGAGSEAGG